VKVQAALTVVRDILSMGLGTFIIVNEELTGRVHTELLILSTALLGLPSTVAIANLIRGKPTTPDTPSGSSSSRSRSRSR
jgi:hypothetical protein